MTGGRARKAQKAGSLVDLVQRLVECLLDIGSGIGQPALRLARASGGSVLGVTAAEVAEAGFHVRETLDIGHSTPHPL
jgi:hypothetical protein